MTGRQALLAGLLITALSTPAGATTRSGTAADAARPKAGASARTLQDIHIEGEIPVPQVLFITARDQRRFMEFQHRRYLRTCLQLGESTLVPTTIVVTGLLPARQEEISR
jgi:hypothetical protein